MSNRPTTSNLDVDLFADDALEDPYPHYETLRAAGGAVYLQRLGMWVLPRYDEVRIALGDHETFSSRFGVGLNDTMNAMRVGTLISSDPPEHDRLRQVLADRLSPRALRAIRADIERRAGELVTDLVGRERFDAVADFGETFPLSVVADLIGVPQEGRDELLVWAEAAFNSFGPENARTRASLPKLEEQAEYLATVATEGRLAPGSMGRAVYEAAERGEIGRESCLPLMTGYLTAGMDTTIHSLGNAMWLLARHPQAWDALRSDPSLIPGAYNEVLRLESPVQMFSRVTTRSHEVGAARLPAGARVGLLYGSANRDESKWDDPTTFDIHRNPVDHLAFGYGLHGCAGQGLARLEAHALLSALAHRVKRITLDGEPVRRLNNVVRGFASLPVHVVGA